MEQFPGMGITRDGKVAFMPKETVYDTDGRVEMQVTWGPEGRDVRLGIETQAGFSLMSMLYGDEHTLALIGNGVAERFGLSVKEGHSYEELGRDILDIIEGTPGSPGASGYTGIWMGIDRNGINRLVTFMRKARDSVFGKDQ